MDYQTTIQNLNKNQSGRPRTGRGETGIAQGYSSIRIEETSSVREIAFISELCYPTVHRILRKDLHTHLYKAQISQNLSEDHYGRRLTFCLRVQKMVAAEILDLKTILFSDEAHLYVMIESNRQKLMNWSTTKPEFQVSTPLHPAKVKSGVD